MNTPSHWRNNETTLIREYDFASFKEALVFVNKVGEIAENTNHHPDITISYTKVVLTLTTHDAGGLTKKDLDLALKINEIVL